MKLVLLGTTGYHPNDRRQTACLLIPEYGLMLDAGTGMYRAPEYLQTPTLDIFLTHAHLDHVIGLTFLFDIAWLHPLERVTVHAQASALAAIDAHLFAEPLFPLHPPYEQRPLTGEVPLPDEGRLRWFPLVHPGGAIGFRLDWPGHSMAYVTDTVASPGADYLDVIRGVDLLVHECYFSDDLADWAQKTGHSHTTAVAQLAREAAVGRVLLVHTNPANSSADPVGLATAQAIFPKIALGEDRMEVEF